MYTAEMVVTNFHALCPLTPGSPNCSMLRAAPFEAPHSFSCTILTLLVGQKLKLLWAKPMKAPHQRRGNRVLEKECQNEGLCDECIDCYYPKRGTREDHVISNCGYRSVQLWWRGSSNLLQIKTLSLPRFTPRDSLCR